MATNPPFEQLAAQLLYLQRQEKSIKEEIAAVKESLEELYAGDAIPAKGDADVLFSDGKFRKVRLQRVSTGTYFKVEADYKDEYSRDSHDLQAKYLKAGKATMADKACSWKVQEVK